MKNVILMVSMFVLIACSKDAQIVGGPANPSPSPGLQGLPGPIGPQGIPGLQGPVGLQGMQGMQGLKGNTGASGANGAQGPQGLTGATGSQGIQGVAGPKGDKGLTGDKGSVGPSGSPGLSGSNGKNGTDGQDGFNTLVKFTRQTNLSSCDHDSGVVVTSGLDENQNGILDGNEVLVSSYVCDGQNNCSHCDDDDGCGHSKVYVCHKDCKGKSQTLYLPSSAVQAHLNHGDKLGKCN